MTFLHASGGRMSQMAQSGHLPRGDRLAIERTLLANERTFLAYFRTAVALLTGGLALLHIDFFLPIRNLSHLLVGLSVFILILGIWRLLAVRRRILKFYQD